ncbi:MFS transporter [Afifella sp. IM 167]|uniref:MFS transporter n=1 Tax=Afifella sp. IM 167 TaxID=2033586 RepID=UPI001CCC85AC|nr:MFS transporter [Afifella sp. IM 167]MBZ8133393.1 MFS transporter [Afifella sp. IM 167]
MSTIGQTSKPAGTAATALPWLIIGSACAVALMTFGPRSAMGFFQLPLLAEKGWDRTTFGLAMAIQNLAWGIGQPFFGALADRFGSARVLILCAVMYAAGLLIMAWSPAPIWLHIGGGVLIGLAVAAGSFGIVMAALARRVPAEKRSFVFGLATAAGSFGMFAFAPLSQAMINALGWSDALVGLALLMGLIPLLAIPLRGQPRHQLALGEVEQTVGDALGQALRHPSFLLLTSGFFVCGFQVAFITAHFPAYIGDLGLSARWAVVAISLIGFFNVIGSLASGAIGQRYSKPHFLSLIYVARSVTVTAFLFAPPTPTSVVIFSIVMGLLWLSTVPPTNALVAIMFGTRHLGMLGGLVFFSHQIGSFLGVWMGGYLYDKTGSYDAVWWLGVALGLFAAVVHWPIKERAAPAFAAA